MHNIGRTTICKEYSNNEYILIYDVDESPKIQMINGL